MLFVSFFIIFSSERRAADGFHLMFLFWNREQDTHCDFVATKNTVRQFVHGNIVAVANLEMVLLDTHHKNKGIRVFNTMGIIDHPVDVKSNAPRGGVICSR